MSHRRSCQVLAYIVKFFNSGRPRLVQKETVSVAISGEDSETDGTGCRPYASTSAYGSARSA